MRLKGIGPDELLALKKEQLAQIFSKSNPLHGEKLEDFYRHYEARRQQKIQLLVREREALIELEKR